MQLQERFRTRRLLLTRPRRSDFDDLLRMHRDPRVTQTLCGSAQDGHAEARVEELVSQWERHGFGWWVARDPESGHFIGRGGLRPVIVDGAPEVEVGFGLLPEFWGRGYATEIARVSIAQGFVRLGLPDVVSLTQPGNRASRRVMEKARLRYERDTVHGGLPHVLYRLTAEAWRTAPVARAGGTARAAAALHAGC